MPRGTFCSVTLKTNHKQGAPAVSANTPVDVPGHQDTRAESDTVEPRSRQRYRSRASAYLQLKHCWTTSTSSFKRISIYQAHLTAQISATLSVLHSTLTRQVTAFCRPYFFNAVVHPLTKTGRLHALYTTWHPFWDGSAQFFLAATTARASEEPVPKPPAAPALFSEGITQAAHWFLYFRIILQSRAPFLPHCRKASDSARASLSRPTTSPASLVVSENAMAPH